MNRYIPALVKLTAFGLVACAVAIWIQWLSGDPAYPKFSPGPIFFVFIAAVVALGGRWRWTPLLGALLSLLVTVSWFERRQAEIHRLTDPAAVGNFTAGIFLGTLLLIVALLLTDFAGIAATIQNYSKRSGRSYGV